MPLDLSELDVKGFAIPGSYVRHELESWLSARNLIHASPAAGNADEEAALADCLALPASAERVAEALQRWLGYDSAEAAEPGSAVGRNNECVGYRLLSANNVAVRVWVLPYGATFDAPPAIGVAYRYRAAAIAERQLRHFGDRLGLLTNGRAVRVVFVDASERESSLSLILPDGAIAGPQRDALRLFKAMCQPSGLPMASAMLAAVRVWRRNLLRALRTNLRHGVERFIQGLLDIPANRAHIAAFAVQESLAKDLFHEALILAYRLLFVLRRAELPRVAKDGSTIARLDKSSHPDALAHLGGTNPSAGTSLVLISRLLGRLQRERGHAATQPETLAVAHELFGRSATPTLDVLVWTDFAMDALIDGLLTVTAVTTERPQVLGVRTAPEINFDYLDIEDLGHVYEGLLDLEPGIATEPMCRLRGTKLEVVLPLAAGEEYQRATPRKQTGGASGPASRTNVTFVETIAPGAFYLRVGLGRKTSGSYYTPKAFVQFLVQESLSHQLEAKSPVGDPNPWAILSFKVIDPAMGSGHFLVEACRYLGEALFEAYCLCYQLQKVELSAAKQARLPEERHAAESRAKEHAERIAMAEQLAPELLRDVAPHAEDLNHATLQAALSSCQRLIANHCLYGIDKDRLAVALARVALGLVSCANRSVAILDRHLMVGDCLTGASLEHLNRLPRTKQPVAARQGASLDAALGSYVSAQLKLALSEHAATLRQFSQRNATDRFGEDPLAPMKQLAAAYIGGVMLESGCDDEAYAQLVWSIATGTGDVNLVDASATLKTMLELGRDAVAFELCFPEVFFPAGDLEQRGGFNAVLGNPPWDAVKFNTKEFLATFDLRVLEAPTKRERDQVEAALTQSPEIAQKFSEYKEHFAQFKRSNDRLYTHQKLMIDGDLAGRQLDRYRLVIERASQILAHDGFIGLVVPSSFHTAAGAAGVRRLVTEPFRLLKYISFINDLKHFDIAQGIEFGLLLAAGPATPRAITRARFRLRDPEALSRSASLDLLEYPVQTLCAGNPYLTFPSIANSAELEALAACRSNKQCFRELEVLSGVEIRSTPTSVHMTHEAKHFVPLRDSGFANVGLMTARVHEGDVPSGVVLHEGATFGRYTDRWSEPPRLAIEETRVASSERWRVLAGHYKVALRAIVGHSKDKCVSALLPPGCLVANSALVEGTPELRTNAAALMVVALLNSNVLSWLLGFYADLNVNLFALRYLPVPSWPFPPIVAHNALRLCCNHVEYAALWQEQLGNVWHEAEASRGWPVLGDLTRRRQVLAINDAIFATEYGLSRRQYGYVLDAMSHSEPATSPGEYLAVFDEILEMGLEAFSRRHDPYWDVPLVTARPSVASASSERPA